MLRHNTKTTRLFQGKPVQALTIARPSHTLTVFLLFLFRNNFPPDSFQSAVPNMNAIFTWAKIMHMLQKWLLCVDVVCVFEWFIPPKNHFVYFVIEDQTEVEKSRHLLLMIFQDYKAYLLKLKQCWLIYFYTIYIECYSSEPRYEVLCPLWSKAGGQGRVLAHLY